MPNPGFSRLQQRPHLTDPFTPKLVTTLREGYDAAAFRADLVAGLTVAIVALPLAMAIAIASGTTPERGLLTAIIAGFLISAFGGSRFQIGGPTGAFIIVVHGVIERHGFDGMLLATVLAGLMLLAAGALRLGTYIKYVPYPVTTGFTAGIAIIILTTQIPDLLGLDVVDAPADFLPKIGALVAAMGTISPVTILVSLLSLGLILALRRWRPNWPAFLIAVAAGAVTVAAFGLDVDSIGSRFGGIPRSLPAPELPHWTIARVTAVLPDAVAIALLAGIESLLSAVIADGMTGRQHRPNVELLAQGGANIASALFGGLPATGAIARTATNIRAGARSPVAGMLHAGFLLVFMLVAAPLAAFIPLASLGAVLAVIAWNMSEAGHVAHILRHAPTGDRVVLVLTFLLTVLVDLTFAIQAGVGLAALLFMHRMAQIVDVEMHTVRVEESQPRPDVPAGPSVQATGADGFVVYRINGPFFFGAASDLTAMLHRPGARPQGYIFDFSAVPMIDSTGAAALASFAGKARARGEIVVLAAVKPNVRRILRRMGLKPPLVRLAASVASTLSWAARKQGPERAA